MILNSTTDNIKMVYIYLLSSFGCHGQHAFTTRLGAITWFVDNIVNEYADYHNNHDYMIELYGPDYLSPDGGVLDSLLEKFEFTLRKIPFNPN